VLNASGAIESGTLAVKPAGADALRYVDVELAIKTTAANTTRVFSAMAWTAPGS
jgi:hypothetical protein